jgi:hypothetical protein
LWRKCTIKTGERSLYTPAGLFVAHICFYAVDPMLIRKIYDQMIVKTIINWTGQPFLASRFFAPLVKSSTLAVVATEGEEGALPIAARVVFAREAEDAAHVLDEECGSNDAAGVVARSLRSREHYSCETLIDVWCRGERGWPNMRFGSVTVADNDAGAAMIDYASDRCVREKRIGHMALQVPTGRVVHAQDPTLVAKRVRSVQTTMIRSSVAPDGKPFVPADSWGDSTKTMTAQGLVPSEVEPVPWKDRPGGGQAAEAVVGPKHAKRQRQRAAQSLEAQADIIQKKQRRIYAQLVRVSSLSVQRALVDYYFESQGEHPVPPTGIYFDSDRKCTLVKPETSAAEDTPAADAKVPGQKLHVANEERAAWTAEVEQEEGQSLDALAAMLTSGVGQQAVACGLTNLATKCVREGENTARFEVPIPWNWFVNDEQQERWTFIFLQDARHIRWNYCMVCMGQYYLLKLIVGEVWSTWFDHFVDMVEWRLWIWNHTKPVRKNLSRVGGYLADYCLAELFRRSGETVRA